MLRLPFNVPVHDMTSRRKILVDNATLSGVERLTGRSKISNMSNIDNDILCLEKLVTAILFSEEIISVDDYKDEFRSHRARNFSFVNFIEKDPEEYGRISSEASDFARSMVFSIDGSKPAGDVVAFFEALRIDPQLRWDIFVSSEYLTLSLLVNDTKDIRYERAIDSVFRSENANASIVNTASDIDTKISVPGNYSISDVKQLVKAFASENANYKGEDSKSLLDRCVFGYGWAAERSYFYNAIAEREGADAFLAPLRDAFCESCCRLESRSQVSALLDSLKYKSQNTISKIVDASGRAKFALKLPFFTAYLISKTRNPQECIELALDMRHDEDFVKCRDLFHNMSYLNQQERYTETNRILKLLEQSCDKLTKKYAVSTSSGPQVSFSIGISGPSISTGLKLDWLFSYYRNKPFTRIFRNISQDMLNIERLGGLYEKLTSSIKQHEEVYQPKFSVTPKYMEKKDGIYSRPAEIISERTKRRT